MGVIEHITVTFIKNKPYSNIKNFDMKFSRLLFKEELLLLSIKSIISLLSELFKNILRIN
jgi:hypothetical protein